MDVFINKHPKVFIGSVGKKMGLRFEKEINIL